MSSYPKYRVRAEIRLFLMILCTFVLAPGAFARVTQSPVSFQNKTADLGLSFENGAACWVDVDNDGWVDLCAGSVWRNNEGKSFTKLADGLGSVLAADFDNDGFADLFSWSHLKLYHNIDGKEFVPVTLPELPATVSRGACWGDFNGDGFVDLYIGGYEDWNNNITYPDIILMNKSGKSFELAWSETRYRARGVTACDFDRDGDLDIYVSNYRLQPNLLRLNDGSGRLTDAAAEYNAVGTSPGFAGGHSIGAAWGDFDSDGNMDLFVGNFAHVDSRGDQPKSRFLRNLGHEKGYRFEDLGDCGVLYQESFASPSAGDYDNDGLPDLFFTTVYGTASFGRPNHPVLYHNDGNFVFTDQTESANAAKLEPTYQAAWGDFNNDGYLDLVSAGKLFVNQGGKNRWLKVRLTGDGRVVNRSAIGAQARIKLKDNTLTRQVEAGVGEGNQNDLTLHFGLGRRIAPVDMQITWPNGEEQSVRVITTNRTVSVTYEPQK